MNRRWNLYFISCIALVVIIGWLHISVVDAQSAGIIAVAWSPDGSKIAVAGVGGLLQILDSNESIIHNITGLTETVNTVDWSPDSSKIVSGSEDGSVYIWDVSSSQRLAALDGAGFYLWAVDWSPDGTKILGSGFQNYSPNSGSYYSLIVWDASNYQQLAIQNVGDSVDAEWSPDSTKIACANSAGYLNIFDPLLADTNTYFTIDEGQNYGPISVSWSPDGRKIATGSTNIQQSKNSFSFDIKIWDFGTGKLSETYTGYTDMIDAIAFSPDGQQLASASRDGTVRIWNTNAGQQIASFPKSRTFTNQLAWSPDSRKLAYGSGRDGLQIVSAPINVTYTPGPPPTYTPLPPTLSAQTLKPFLQPAICSRTCFLGLQPGVTTQDELEKWIVQHDIYLSIDNRGTDYTGKTMRELTWFMDNPALAVGSGERIRVNVKFSDNVLVSIETSMNIPMAAILKAYGQPIYFGYFQYMYYAVYPTQKLLISFPENLSNTYEQNTALLTFGIDTFINNYINPLYLPVEKCTGGNLLCIFVQTATPSP